MNQWGSACRDHLDEITTHMIDEAIKRGWKLAKMPGAKRMCEILVLRSIRKYERATALQIQASHQKTM